MYGIPENEIKISTPSIDELFYKSKAQDRELAILRERVNFLTNKLKGLDDRFATIEKAKR